MDLSESEDFSTFESFDHIDFTFMSLYDRVKALLTEKFDVELSGLKFSEWSLSGSVFVGGVGFRLDGEVFFQVNKMGGVEAMHVFLDAPALTLMESSFPCGVGGRLTWWKEGGITSEDVTKYLEACERVLQWHCIRRPAGVLDDIIEAGREDGCLYEFSPKPYRLGSPGGFEPGYLGMYLEKKEAPLIIESDAWDAMRDWDQCSELSEDLSVKETQPEMIFGLTSVTGRTPSRILDFSRYYADPAKRPIRRKVKYGGPNDVKRLRNSIRRCAKRFVG